MSDCACLHSKGSHALALHRCFVPGCLCSGYKAKEPAKPPACSVCSKTEAEHTTIGAGGVCGKYRPDQISGPIGASYGFSIAKPPAHAPTPAVPMVLGCPKCSAPHVDLGEWATRPHKTHQCQSCMHEWRPFDYATVGVAPSPDSAAIHAACVGCQAPVLANGMVCRTCRIDGVIEDKAWLCGYAAALGALVRLFHYDSVAVDIMKCDGVTLDHLVAAGVEDFDLRQIKKAGAK